MKSESEKKGFKNAVFFMKSFKTNSRFNHLFRFGKTIEDEEEYNGNTIGIKTIEKFIQRWQKRNSRIQNE